LQEDIRQLVGSSWVEEIEIRADDPSQIQAAVDAGRLVGRRVSLASPLHQSELPALAQGEHWVRDGQAWALLPPQRPRAELAVKRLMDLVVSAALLILLLPLLLTVAVVILLTSGGPILYAWRVLGENGRPFVGYKFRTMVRDADALKPQLMHLNERTGPVFKMAEDPRVTSLGRSLRKYSLDELPQLWSVLVGDMSLVGPRPVFSSEYQKCELWQMRKLSVKPGLTCLWQVEGRQTVTDFSDWARLDLRYIDNWSLWSDAAILFRTPIAIVRGTGH
jgi:lipopolysaccharide/colanic/teichoic acid biosynthesis glycosyltransferase